ERPRERHSLLLTARQHRRRPGVQATQADGAEDGHDPIASLGARHAQLLKRERDVLEHRHVGPDGIALEDHAHAAPLRRHEQSGLGGGHRAASHEDLTPIGTLESGDEPEGGRLAAAAGPEEREELPGSRLEAQVVHGDHGAERLDQTDRSNRAHGWSVIQPSAASHGKPKNPLTARGCPPIDWTQWIRASSPTWSCPEWRWPWCFSPSLG